MTKLSIIISHFNQPQLLHQCLISISKSSFKNHEVIVIDDGSLNPPLKKSLPFISQLIKLDKNYGRNFARLIGIQKTDSNIIVNIDSDVQIQPNTLTIIANYFSKNPKLSAITGLLSKNHPNSDFSSQYKNLYMNFHFSKLPKEVNFLYGSIYAFKKSLLKHFNPKSSLGEDTELGQQLTQAGHTIHLLKNLQVTHLKKHSLISLIKNDFLIPFNWAQIFLSHKGWQQLGQNHTGFAHASKSQIISLFLAPLTTFTITLSIFNLTNFFIIIVPLLSWTIFNWPFHKFLVQQKGFIFTLKSWFFTFLDHHIMLSGIIAGSIYYVFHFQKPAR